MGAARLSVGDQVRLLGKRKSKTLEYGSFTPTYRAAAGEIDEDVRPGLPWLPQQQQHKSRCCDVTGVDDNACA